MNTLKKYRYRLKNLDCANCANKIERALSDRPEFQRVSVNFNTLTLSLETNMENPRTIIEELILSIEPDVELHDFDENIAKESSILFPILRLLLGILLGIIGGYVSLPWKWNTIFLIAAYLILLYRTFVAAVKLMIRSHTINENLLITISCVGAYLVGEHMEGLMVIVLYEIGKILEEKAVSKSRNSIRDLMNIRPEFAHLRKKDTYVQVSPEEVQIGDHILVKAGEKVPVDGKVIKGTTSLDVAALTGESVPREVQVEDEILSGSVNLGNAIEVEVTASYQESTVARILDLVENATDKKARVETFVSKASRIYTPIVLLLAVLTAFLLPVFTKIPFEDSIYRALIFLVISCPCAIAISVPLSYFSGIGRASKSGVLIKGSDYLEGLASVREVVCDKTGTLTTGTFEVAEIIPLQNHNKEQILDLVAKGEFYSNHPIARSILKKKGSVETKGVSQVKEISGKGIYYQYQNHQYFVGNASFVGYNEEDNSPFSVIYLKEDDTIIGKITLEDEIKSSAYQLVSLLKQEGIQVRMLTGDSKTHASLVAEKLKIQNYDAELLPEDKYHLVEAIISKNQSLSRKVAFVGDGINDAPVLALADIGISMGGVGSNSAIEASDVVIMNDDLAKIPFAFALSRKTRKIIKQNLIFAIGTKVFILLLSVVGFAGMWQAIFADVGVTLITILNTLRILKMREK